jgi:radical SAM superfamily enzyme YgiQ (UPF0313 family)
VKLLLLNPPSPFLIDQKAFPPLGILYLAAAAREAGIEAEVRDLAGGEGDLDAAVSGLEGDVVGLTCTTPQYPWAQRVMQRLRVRLPRARFVAGGAHPSSAPERCVADGFDAAVAGEGERAILRIVREGLGGVVREPYVKDIDTLPPPARDLVDIRGYGYSIEGGLATTLITSRGCPYQCAFCSKDVWQRGVRFHSVARVVSEIRECMDRYGFRHFLFLDDSLALAKKRLREFCDAVDPLKVAWRAYARSDRTTREMLEDMKRAGCVEVGIGVESGSQKVLDAVCKGTTVEQNSRLVQWCREVGIVSNAFVMIGLPGETRETVEATRRWMEENRPDKFGYNIFSPYIGTPISAHPDRYDLKTYPMPDERSWVKGRQGEYESFVATSALSREEILRLFEENFRVFQDLLRWKPGVGRVDDRKP